MPAISRWEALGSAEGFESVPAWLAFQEAARRYRDDGPWRARIDGGDAEALSALMRDVALSVASDTAVRVVANDAGTFHFVLPPDPNAKMADEALAGIAGGARASSLSSVGSVATVACSTAPSTLTSAATSSSAAPD